MLGMSGTLWLGAGLCGFGFISAIIVIGLDKHGTKQLGTDGDIKTASKLVKPRDILNFNVSFWLLALTIMFFYNGKLGCVHRSILSYCLISLLAYTFFIKTFFIRTFFKYTF